MSSGGERGGRGGRGGRGRGESGRGRGESGRGGHQGDSGRGRGESGGYRGDSGRGGHHGERGGHHGESGGYRGESGRGRGERGGYRGESQRGGRDNFPQQQRPPSQQQQQRPPSQQAQQVQKIIPAKMENMGVPKSVQKSQYLVQGAPGKNGRPVRLFSNFVPIQCPQGPFVQYYLKFTPEVESRYLAYLLLRQHSETVFKDMAFVFDGNQMLFCERALNQDKKTIELISKRDTQTFKLEIGFAASVSSSDVTHGLLQLFNLIFRRGLRHLNLQQFGRNHYNMSLAIDIPKYNVKVVPGYLTTLSLTSLGVMMNIDVIYRTLRTDSVLSLILQYKEQFGPQYYKEEVEKNVKYSIVLCSYNNKTVQVQDIDWTKNPSHQFLKGGKKITLKQYYKEHHGKDIKDNSQPLLVHYRKPKSKDEEPEIEYFVPELCQLTGITDDMRKDRFAMKDIKECTSLNPVARFSDIMKFAGSISSNKEMSNDLKKWGSGFNVQPQLLELPGRVLERQIIRFQNQTVRVDESGGFQLRNTPLFHTVGIEEWIVVEVPGMSDDVDNFIKVLRQVAKPLGIPLGNNVHIVSPVKTTPEEYRKAISAAVKEHSKAKIVLVCLPNDKKPLYSAVKNLTAIELKIPSQCVQRKTFSRDSKGIQSKATKVVVQMQAKVGGIPWSMDFKFPGPMMICGVDVFHSGEKVTRKKSSIVGFTASLSNNVGNYYSDFKVQKPGQEIIDGIQTCFADAIAQFTKKNNTPPKFILFYRDGVGEGQLQQVYEKEVKPLKQCLQTLGLGETKLCFMVVLKRIHERVVCGQVDNPVNPEPGTICDTGIVSKDALEFLLVPHHVNQGTATPTKFQCIENMAGFGTDYLQDVTFKLCHMYFNWSGAIRVPAPCMFAHKIAFLVGESSMDTTKAVTELRNLLWYL